MQPVGLPRSQYHADCKSMKCNDQSPIKNSCRLRYGPSPARVPGDGLPNSPRTKDSTCVHILHFQSPRDRRAPARHSSSFGFSGCRAGARRSKEGISRHGPCFSLPREFDWCGPGALAGRPHFHRLQMCQKLPRKYVVRSACPPGGGKSRGPAGFGGGSSYYIVYR